MSLEIAAFSKEITPPAGVLLAGYGPEVVSRGVHDPLFLKGLAFREGSRKALLLSFDLLGLDRDFVVAIRKACAASARIPAENVVLTCTHTHSGPHTRTLGTFQFSPSRLREFRQYRRFLVRSSAEAVTGIFSGMRKADVYHYSVRCHENLNRRYVAPDNTCVYLPEAKHLIPLANNITDPELGMLFFIEPGAEQPIAVLANYAAHPLTCQAEGLSSHLISADYPGVLRREVESRIGGACVFTSGACGDLHPKGFESGFARTEEMGKLLASRIAESCSDVLRNQERYRMTSDFLNVRSFFVKLPFRTSGCDEPRLPLYRNRHFVNAELQILTIGDIALVGVPGELLCGPGLEIKWNSPFRKTFILYNSTAYLSYLPPVNCFVQGAYEAETCHLMPTAAFTLVSGAVRALEEMKNPSEYFHGLRSRHA